MPAQGAPSRFFYLYRQAEGVIDAGQWARAAWPPAAIGLAIILPWAVLRPSLADSELAASTQMVAFAYFSAYLAALIVSVAAMLFVAVAEYCVCAKRFRDRGMRPELAGVAPLSIVLAGAVHWIAARDAEAGVSGVAYVLDGFALAACLWTIFQLNFGATHTKL